MDTFNWLLISCAGAIWTWPAIIISEPWALAVFSAPGLFLAIVGLVGVVTGVRR